MKRNLFISVLIIVAIAGFIYQISSMQGRTQAEEKTPVPVMQTAGQISGNVTQVDLKNSQFVIFNDIYGWPIFVVNQNTKMAKRGKNIQLSNIKPGDFITISYESIKGKNIAKSVYFK